MGHTTERECANLSNIANNIVKNIPINHTKRDDLINTLLTCNVDDNNEIHKLLDLVQLLNLVGALGHEVALETEELR